MNVMKQTSMLLYDDRFPSKCAILKSLFKPDFEILPLFSGVGGGEGVQ